MPDNLAEGLFALLFLLFGIVLPLVLRARGAAQRARQLMPRPPQVRQEPEEEPARKPVIPAAAAPIPAPPRPAVAPPREAPLVVPPRAPAPAPRSPLAALGGLQRLRQLTPWQQAVVWAEILGPPRGLQEGPPSG